MPLNSTAIVIHKAELSNFENILSVTAHEIHHGDKQSSLGPGRVFSNDDKASLAMVLSGDSAAPMELLSPHCLAAGKETLLWHRPRQKTTINVDGKLLDVHLPSLVFLAHKGELFVMATQGTKRPEPDSPLLFSGMPNAYKNGLWCSGGNRIPDNPQQRHIEQIERLFFESPFTHWGAERPKDSGDMTDWFTNLATKNRFPMRSLNSINLNLGLWFRSITNA